MRRPSTCEASFQSALMILIVIGATLGSPLVAQPVTLENGRVFNSFDRTSLRGKFFEGVPSGTVTEVCVFAESAGTDVVLGLKERLDAAPPLYEVEFSVNRSLSWSCKSVSWPWSSGTLLIYKLAGTAAIGYEYAPPHDSHYSSRGTSWSTDSARRGFRLTMTPQPAAPSPETYRQLPPPQSLAGQRLENGGDADAYDGNDYRGKLFSSVPSGTLTEICVFGRDAGSSVTVGIKTGADSSSPQIQETISITGRGIWSCKSVSYPWSSSSLLIYKMAGNGAVGYDGGSPGDSYYSNNRGESWSTDGNRRGYRLSIGGSAAPSTGSSSAAGGATSASGSPELPPDNPFRALPPPQSLSAPSGTTLENGGDNPAFDGNDYRGKLFSAVPTGTITQICVFGQDAGSLITVGLKTAAGPSPPAVQDTISISVAGGWSCKSVSHPWSSSTLLIYKMAGNGAVGYDADSPGDSYYSNDRGSSWATDGLRRGYRVVIGGSSSGGGGGGSAQANNVTPSVGSGSAGSTSPAGDPSTRPGQKPRFQITDVEVEYFPWSREVISGGKRHVVVADQAAPPSDPSTGVVCGAPRVRFTFSLSNFGGPLPSGTSPADSWLDRQDPDRAVLRIHAESISAIDASSGASRQTMPYVDVTKTVVASRSFFRVSVEGWPYRSSNGNSSETIVHARIQDLAPQGFFGEMSAPFEETVTLVGPDIYPVGGRVAKTRGHEREYGGLVRLGGNAYPQAWSRARVSVGSSSGSSGTFLSTQGDGHAETGSVLLNKVRSTPNHTPNWSDVRACVTLRCPEQLVDENRNIGDLDRTNDCREFSASESAPDEHSLGAG